MADLILWEGNVRMLSLAERVEVARGLGCEKMSVSPNTLEKWWADGITFEAIHELPGNVRITHLDPLVRWNRGYRLEDLGPQLREFSTSSREAFFECAARVGVESMTLPAIVQSAHASLEELASDFADVCDEARQHDIRCDLEFLPYWSGVPDLQTAVAIVELAGRANGALLFDVYHFMRGPASPSEILEVDGKLISAIQISDGPRSLPPDVDAVHDMLNCRQLPGDGEFPLDEIIQNLRAIGAGETVGVEVFSTELDARPIDGLIEVLGEATHHYLGLPYEIERVSL